MDISIASEATMSASLPSAGNVTLFINTDKNNVLYYVNSDGEFFIYSASDTQNMEDCCSCEIAKMWTKSVTCGLENGTLIAADFGTIMNQGLSVVTTETTDPDTGVKTCRVDVGPKTTTPVVSVTITGAADRTLTIGVTEQLAVTVLPSTAPQGVIWVSSNPAKAVVTQSGLVLGLAAGTTTVYAYSQADGTKFDAVNYTVS